MAQVSPAPAKQAAKAPAPRRSPLGWILGWVLTPALLLGLIFGAGVYVGANHPESWAPRAALWIAALFA